jgi:hypothetical protein
MQYLNPPSNDEANPARTPKNSRRQKNSEPASWIKAAQPCAPACQGLAGSAAEFVHKRMPLCNRPNPMHTAPLRETLGKLQANGRSSGDTTIDDPCSRACRGTQTQKISNLTADRFGSARFGPCGLYNGYNSDANLCFMNSALQLIFHSFKDFGADLGRCEGAVAKAVRVIGEAAFEACRNRQNCLSQVAY